jgi:hypothetical protein
VPASCFRLYIIYIRFTSTSVFVISFVFVFFFYIFFFPHFWSEKRVLCVYIEGRTNVLRMCIGENEGEWNSHEEGSISYYVYAKLKNLICIKVRWQEMCNELKMLAFFLDFCCRSEIWISWISHEAAHASPVLTLLILNYISLISNFTERDTQKKSLVLFSCFLLFSSPPSLIFS